jgi:hypothetical protein
MTPHSRSLFSLSYLYYSHFSSCAMHGKLNEHQYNFIGSLLTTDERSILNSNPLFTRSARFLSALDSGLLHSRVVSVSLQALASLALNSEESRRIIGESGTDLVARLIELIETESDEHNHDGELKINKNNEHEQ